MRNYFFLKTSPSLCFIDLSICPSKSLNRHWCYDLLYRWTWQHNNVFLERNAFRVNWTCFFGIWFKAIFCQRKQFNVDLARMFCKHCFTCSLSLRDTSHMMNVNWVCVPERLGMFKLMYPYVTMDTRISITKHKVGANHSNSNCICAIAFVIVSKYSSSEADCFCIHLQQISTDSRVSIVLQNKVKLSLQGKRRK